MAAGEEVVVVQALEEMAGLPAVAFSRLPVLRHHVPGIDLKLVTLTLTST